MKKSVAKTETLRKKAEKLLENKKAETNALLSEYEAMRLIQELQVHQIELELQNEELMQAKERAEESDRFKTTFLQNMSHEIRTPMNAIKGFSSLLASCYNDEEKLEKFTRIINQRCDDLLNIINDVLNIATIESGQVPIYLEACNLVDLFDELSLQFNEYRQRQNKQHIQLVLQTNCQTAGEVILADKGKLKQIFTNLLTNAFKFTNEGIIEGGCKLKNNTLTFYVSDTGIGIPSDKQSEVFERFAQLRQSENRAMGGTGLGLSISKGLVHVLGGKILLDSVPGKGSTFSFTLPYQSVHGSHK